MKNNKILRLALTVFIILLSFYGMTLFSNAAQSLNLQVTPLTSNTDTQIKLNWSSIQNASYYDIYVNTHLVNTIDVEHTQDYLTYTVTGLTPETSNNFQVKALTSQRAIIETDSNTLVNINTGKMLSPTIASVAYDINRNIVNVTYANNSLAAKNAKITASYTPDPAVPIGTATATIGNQISVPLTSQPADGSEITVKLTVYDSMDNSGNTVHESSAVTGTIIAINAPALSVSVTHGTATVSWPAGFTSYVGGFNLERSRFTSNAWDTWQVVNTSSLSGTSATDIPALPGTYRYRLNAKTGGQYSGYSAVTPNTLLPGRPTGLTCSLSSSGVILRWTNDPNNTATLLVYRSTLDHIYHEIAHLDPSISEYVDADSITNGSTYYYYVIAFDNNMNLQTSNLASITVTNPSDPSNLMLTIISSSQVDLSWADNVSNEQGFIIEKKIGSGSYTQIATVPANTTSYSDKTVTPGNTYSYRVCAFNPLSNSGYTNEVSCKTTDLTAPNFLEIIQVSSSELDLKWSYPFEKKYTTVIEYSISNSNSWSTLATVSDTADTIYKHTGLNANTKYSYRIRAVSGNYIQSSIYPNNASNSKSAYTLMNTPVITSITQPALNQATISWSDAGIGVTGYSIERKSDTETYGVVTVTGPNVTSWTDKNLRQGVIYTYRIKAICTDNSSQYSAEASTDSRYTGAPSNLTIHVNPDYTVKLTWTDNSSIEDEYRIWRMDNNNGNWYEYAVAAPDSTSYIDTISPNVTYSYKVRYHINSTNSDSAFSNIVSNRITQPESPSYLSYSLYSSNTCVLLTWTDMSNNESGFKIERRTGYGGSWIQLASVSSGRTYYYDTDLSPNTQYFYRVKSFLGDYSASSYEIEVNTGITSPVNLTFDAPASDTVKLKWDCTAPNVAGFRIERRLASSGSAYTILTTVSKDAESYTDQSTSSDTYYVYRVGAYTTTGVISYSGEITVCTKSAKYFDDIGYGNWAWTAVQNLASRGILKGSNNKFYPSNTISRAEFVSILVRAFKIDKTPIGSFKDVKPDKWYYNDIMTAKAMGIISGSNNMFYPNRPITREDMAVIAVKTLKAIEKPLPGYSNSVMDAFMDSGVLSDYAKSSMASLIGEKIVGGVSENGMLFIKPKSNLSRAEAAAIIYKIIDR